MAPPVQMGLHTGEASPDDGDYVAPAVHQTTELALAAHGGQIVVSDMTTMLGAPPPGVSTRDLGLYRLRTFESPAHVHQLVQ